MGIHGEGNAGLRFRESQEIELLTVPELAEWLRLRPSTIYSWAAAGRIPCVRIGGRIRFSRGEILRWIEARKEG